MIELSPQQFVHDRFQICMEYILLKDAAFLKGFGRSAEIWFQFDLRKLLNFIAGLLVMLCLAGTGQNICTTDAVT